MRRYNAGVLFLSLRTTSRSAYSTERRLVPPFTDETAKAKVQRAEDLWNTKDPEKVALAYTEDSEWRNRDRFFKGREAIKSFLREKWTKEQEYKLRKYLFTFNNDKIAVHFQYEYKDEKGNWWRAYGNEHWTFDANGLMKKRDMSCNDVPIKEAERLYNKVLKPAHGINK